MLARFGFQQQCRGVRVPCIFRQLARCLALAIPPIRAGTVAEQNLDRIDLSLGSSCMEGGLAAEGREFEIGAPVEECAHQYVAPLLRRHIEGRYAIDIDGVDRCPGIEK